jgi:hypothetical protein
MKPNKLSKKTLLIIGLASVIFEADAATIITATISANIVPASSFSISESTPLNITPEKNSDIQRTQTNNSRIETSSLINKNAVKVKIISGQNIISDLSISSKSVLTDSKSLNKIKVSNWKLHSNTPSLNSNNEQELTIEALPTEPDSKNTRSYSGTTEITVNYY